MSFMTDNETLFRYFHILAGITWIGLLYFFNLVNLPLLKFNLKKPFDVDMTEKMTANITLKTLFWFRWGAMLTFLFGLLLIGARAEAVGGFGAYFFGRGFPGYAILTGVAFGTIMWANVWFIIWPAQQKILSNNKAIASGAENAEELTAANAPMLKNAVLASRTNTWLSIPMLFGMVFSAHGGQFTSWGAAAGPLIVLAVVLALMILYSQPKKEKAA